MPYQSIPNHSEAQYALVSFDAGGGERTDDRDGRMTERVLAEAAAEPVTDAFFFCHGWKGDVPAAVDQYDRWIGALLGQADDHRRMAEVVPGFRPLFIGLHWPSLPFGDESLGGTSFAPGVPGTPADLLESWVAVLGENPQVRASLAIILDEARRNAAATTLPPRAVAAYRELNDALGLGSDGPGGAPDADRGPFDPEAAFVNGNVQGAAFGGGLLGGLLGPLRQLSYWTMKKRGRTIGESGMHDFLKRLLSETAGRGMRVHLMGHSFGCVVVSSMLGGPGGQASLSRPVASVALVQGAVSLWSYAPSIPFVGAGTGYFSQTLPLGKVGGPLITTRSRHDTAVGRLYPLASQLRGSASFAPGSFPELGAVGAWGLQGLAEAIRQEMRMLPADGEYGFSGGRVYNLEASEYIAKGGGVSGAHSDIDGPEVAHALWQAALVAAR